MIALVDAAVSRVEIARWLSSRLTAEVALALALVIELVAPGWLWVIASAWVLQAWAGACLLIGLVRTRFGLHPGVGRKRTAALNGAAAAETLTKAGADVLLKSNLQNRQHDFAEGHSTCICRSSPTNPHRALAAPFGCGEAAMRSRSTRRWRWWRVPGMSPA